VTGPLRVRRAKYGRYAGMWIVRNADATIIGRFPTGAKALDFVRRFIDAATA
jgi:hypothetical protein